MEVYRLLYILVICILSSLKQADSEFTAPIDGPCGRIYFLSTGDQGSDFGETLVPEQDGGYIDIDVSTAIDFDYMPVEGIFLFVDENTLFSWNPETGDMEGPIIDLNLLGINMTFNGIEVNQLEGWVYVGLEGTSLSTFGRVDVAGEMLQMSPSTFPPGVPELASFVSIDSRRTLAVARQNGIYIHKINPSSFTLNSPSRPIRVVLGSTVIAMSIKDLNLYYSLSDPPGKLFCVNIQSGNPCPGDDQVISGVQVGRLGFYGQFFFRSLVSSMDVHTTLELFNVTTGQTTGVCLHPFGITGSDGGRIKQYKHFHFIEDESVCPQPEEDEFSVLIRPPSIRLKNSRSVVIHQNFPEGYQVSFDRAAYTGNARGVPVDIDQTHDRVVLNKKRRDARKAVGVYEHDFQKETGNGGESILSILQWSGKLRFTHTTVTVYQGDTLFLSTPLRSGRARRWRFNGKLQPQWHGSPSLTIPSVNEGHEGIYEIYLNGRRKSAAHGITRVIIPDCQRGTYNAPSCDPSTLRVCFNGGILRDDRDECICAPGFMGETCETFTDVGFFGQQGQLRCPGGSCEGALICLPDPYGCSCAAGYHGPDCNLPCRETTYGANCRNICHCGPGGEDSCDPYTGVCIDSDCSPGFSGANCQELLN